MPAKSGGVVLEPAPPESAIKPHADENPPPRDPAQWSSGMIRASGWIQSALAWTQANKDVRGLGFESRLSPVPSELLLAFRVSFLQPIDEGG